MDKSTCIIDLAKVDPKRYGHAYGIDIAND